MKSTSHIDNKPRLAILLMIAIAFIVAFAQIYFKLASAPYISLIYFIITFLIGVMLYFSSFFLQVIAYHYGELSLLYPISSLSNIIYMIIAYLFFGEALTFWKIFGVLNIMIGVFMISSETGKGGQFN